MGYLIDRIKQAVRRMKQVWASIFKERGRSRRPGTPYPGVYKGRNQAQYFSYNQKRKLPTPTLSRAELDLYHFNIYEEIQR